MTTAANLIFPTRLTFHNARPAFEKLSRFLTWSNHTIRWKPKREPGERAPTYHEFLDHYQIPIPPLLAFAT
jgi:hypothetical protein